MTIFGAILSALGVGLSLATFIHDVRRHRIGREFGGQLAPGRIAPEVHAVAALLAGIGLGLIWGWAAGCAGAAGHCAVAYLVVRPLLNR